ncbi:Kinesin-like protein KIF1B [Frankliniella fusca]|uniref:Kinesin-like protein KIF1B n=1 Tax=Frankliniella fusca TaxID=407009 RepID=A0AAE1GT57_9NEOP|nr:Kinesin-like protein KIF1B [Frankliniella fusca]
MAERLVNERAFRRALNREADRILANRERLERLGELAAISEEEEDDEVDGVINDELHERDEENFEENVEENVEEREDAENFEESDEENVEESDDEENFEESDEDEMREGDNEERVSDSSSESDDNGENEGEEFLNNEQIEQYVKITMKEWALDGGRLSMRKLDNILARLHRVHRSLPLSYKTLLDTPHEIAINNLESGQMWYKSIRENLSQLDLTEYLQYFGEIKIDINMDGLSLFKKSQKKFWPILGKLELYWEARTPQWQTFVLTLKMKKIDLQENGFFHNGVNVPVKIRNYICDAPARAKVKCIIEHGGYCACEKCEVEGEWIANRMTYVDLDQPLRTDDSFRNQTQPMHHNGISPLDETDWLPVSQFRLDPLHLVFLGVYRRLLLAWRKWNGPFKLHVNVVTEIGNLMVNLKSSCPCDFNRPPRSLLELPFYAATEFRRSLLYDGALVFKDILNRNVYNHFLLLHCGMRILCSPVHYEAMNDLANNALRLFISHSVNIYGAKFVVYNVHSLCHLAQECAQYGPADSFSSFDYENKLGSIKRLLQSGYKPLIQVANRDIERQSPTVEILRYDNVVKLARRRRHMVEDEVVDGEQFRFLRFNDVVFKCNKKDNCFKTFLGDVVVMSNIVRRENDIFLVGCHMINKRDLYDYPFPSSEIGILSVSQLSAEKRAYSLNDVECKCWLMPEDEEDELFACFPILHSYQSFLH